MNRDTSTWMKRALPALPLAVALLLRAATAVEAHARFLRSEPGPGAVVSEPPDRVEIWFAQDLFRREGENWIHVFGPEGFEVHNGEAKIDDDDRRHMGVEINSPLDPGEYVVEWRNISAEDGDDDEGDFSFVLDPQAEVTSTPMIDETETPIPPPTAMPESTATATSVSTIPPEPEDSGGCSLGLTPAFALAALGVGLKKRRK